MRRLSPALPLLLVLQLGSCVIVRTPTVQQVNPAPSRVVDAPVRAFMIDGSVVVFPEGVRLLPGRLEGTGTRSDLTRTSSTRVTGLSLDSVMGIQSFDTRLEPSLTVLASVGTTTAGFVAVLLLLCGDGGCAVGSAP